jgi:DNA (cytosine-5)-methyltransferase 1
MKQTTIPIIDLFAGPGGFAEGFSSVFKNNKRIFSIKLSIEKEVNAHQTLELRSFCRQFAKGHIPLEYYEVLRESDINQRVEKRKLLYEKYEKEYIQAKKEAWLAELGSEKFTPAMVDKRIKDALGNTKFWVLIGGPPCQAYSVVGRSRVGGIHVEDHRVFLYKEYLRIIAEHQPAIFVMENVKGLLSAQVNGEEIFDKILKDLKNPSSVFKNTKSLKYKIHSLVKSDVIESKDYLIKAEQYGIPQKRHRVILLGIREDLCHNNETLKSKKVEVTLESVIGKLPKIRSGIYRKFINSEYLDGKKKRYYEMLKDSDKLWEKYVNEFKNEILSWNGLIKYKNKKNIISPKNGIGNEFIKTNNTIDDNHVLKKWYLDKKLDGVINHQSRGHLVNDLRRYLFAELFSKSEGRFPRLIDFEGYDKILMPDHENATSGKFEDRFRVQLPDEAATTITSHISKDGHYFIHYDPEQCRSLTVREAARIQTFPDNYLFCGSRTQQFHQVGNAVPPYLANQIGNVVLNIFKKNKIL